MCVIVFVLIVGVVIFSCDRNSVREYIAEIQKELQLEEQQQQKSKQKYRLKPQRDPSCSKISSPDADKGGGAEEMKAVMDRLESRKLVNILSNGWEDSANADLVARLLANRILYFEEHEMPTERVEELDGEDDDDDDEGDGGGIENARSRQDMERDSPYEALVEYMVDDMSALYEEEVAKPVSGVEEAESFSDRIMAMMEEKYQLRAVEKALRARNAYGEYYCFVVWCFMRLCLTTFQSDVSPSRQSYLVVY